MRRVLLLSLATVALHSAAFSQVLWDNGPLLTGTGNGFNGADTSVLEACTNLFGSNNNINAPIANRPAGEPMYRIADDFTLTRCSDLSELEWFTYQTGSTTTSTITGIYVQIWDGRPGDAGSSVVAGDLTTNLMTATSWTGMYRVTATALTGSTRPIMRVLANLAGIQLEAGTYWIEVGVTGTLASGPWVPPVTPSRVTDNARHFIFTAPGGTTLDWNNRRWANLGEGTSTCTNLLDAPFILRGTAMAGDVNGDCCVDDTDLAIVLEAFGNSGTGLPADLNDDGVVDDTDLAIVLEEFGNGC